MTCHGLLETWKTCFQKVNAIHSKPWFLVESLSPNSRQRGILQWRPFSSGLCVLATSQNLSISLEMPLSFFLAWQQLDKNHQLNSTEVAKVFSFFYLCINIQITDQREHLNTHASPTKVVTPTNTFCNFFLSWTSAHKLTANIFEQY